MDKKSGRFEYVKYDQVAIHQQEAFKTLFEQVEKLVNETLVDGRAKSLVLTELEVAYMWTGKAIRDEQIARNVSPEHVPERG